MINEIKCPLQTYAQEDGTQPAIICGDDITTYQQLNDLVTITTRSLKSLGIKAQDRVAIFSPNSTEYIILLLALWRLKAISCLLSTRLPEKGVEDHLTKTQCHYLFTSLSGTWDTPNKSLKKIDIDEFVPSSNYVSIDHTQLNHFSLDQDLTIIFTSGSTAGPKAALHSFGNHYYNALGSNEHINLNPTDKWLLSLPLYHVGGLSILFRILFAKATLVIPSAGQKIAKTIEKKKITHLSLVPTQLYRLIGDEKNFTVLKNLKAILLGGSPVSDTLIHEAIQNSLPIYLTYGLTEMASQVATSQKLSKSDLTPNLKILKYRKIKISNSNEIFLKGETLFKGYVEKQGLETPFDPEGWFPSGDLGSLNEHGHLNISGRKDNIFISGGENIRPEEIERHLCQMEAIEDAIIVPIKNEQFGFRPVAFIKERRDSKLSKKEILHSLQNRLPRFMLPEQFYFWPQGQNMGIKINRKRLIYLAEHRNSDLNSIKE